VAHLGLQLACDPAKRTQLGLHEEGRVTYLQWGSWIKSCNSICGSALVQGVKNSVENSWVRTEGSFLQAQLRQAKRLTIEMFRIVLLLGLMALLSIFFSQ
jgi:hypothetical protein